jgi:hypothetical protein
LFWLRHRVLENLCVKPVVVATRLFADQVTTLPASFVSDDAVRNRRAIPRASKNHLKINVYK